MTRSLRARLVIGSVIAVALVLVGSGVVVSVVARSSLENELDDAVRSRARELAAQVELDGGRVSNEIDARSLAGDEAFEIWDGERVVGRSDGVELPRASDGDVRTITLAAGPAREVTLGFEPRREPDDRSTTPAPRLMLAFARSTASVEATERRITEVIVGVGGAGIVLCIVLLLVIVRVGLAPVRSLAGAIAEIRETDVSGRTAAITTTATELAPIAQRLDELLVRLALAFERERELTSEVAHELRTPLAGLRVILEVALDRERSPERYRTALVECLDITRQTEAVVETLLALARLDANQAAVSRLQVDVDQLVRDVLASNHVRAEQRRLDVVTELEPISRTTDRDKLRAVIANLVENAVTYADDGGQIRVELTRHSLVISNTGCTLGPEQVAKVFERFWRGDDARSAPGHVGLGLPLCRKLVSLLGGEISVAVRDGRFVATVGLP